MILNEQKCTQSLTPTPNEWNKVQRHIQPSIRFIPKIKSESFYFHVLSMNFSFFLPVVLYAMHPKNTEINHSRCLLVTFFHSILHHQLWPKSHCAMMDALINWGEFVGKKETTLFVIRFILFIKIFRKLWKISHHGHNSHPCKFSFFFSFLKLCESFWWKKNNSIFCAVEQKSNQRSTTNDGKSYLGMNMNEVINNKIYHSDWKFIMRTYEVRLRTWKSQRSNGNKLELNDF